MNGKLILFSSLHLITSITVILLIFFSLFFLKKFKINLHKKYGIFLILYFIIDSLIRNSVRELHFAEYLPLHICSALFFIAAYGFYYKNTIAHQISFFWTFAFTIQSLVTPIPGDVVFSIEYYRYFLTHGLVIFNAFYALLIIDIKVTFKSLIHSFIALQVLMVLATPFNYFFDLNFVFLSEKPPSPTPVDHFGPWPWYILVVDFVSFCVFGILFLLMKILRPHKNNRASEY